MFSLSKLNIYRISMGVLIVLAVSIVTITIRDINNYQEEIEEYQKAYIQKDIEVDKLEALESDLRVGITERDQEIDKLVTISTDLEETVQKLKYEVEELKETVRKKEVTVNRSSEAPRVATKTSTNTNTNTSTNTNTNTSKSGSFQATAYCPCTKCCGASTTGTTASGTKVTANRTIAVDPKVIPLGSTVHIEGYGSYIAEDTGSAVKGNIVDIYFADHQSALNFGRRSVKVSW